MLTSDEKDFVKTSSYYYIAHFSKFIKPNAIKIAHSSYSENLELTAFKNSDNTIAIVLLNKKWFDINYNISINNRIIKDTINANSIVTYLIS